MGNSVGKDAQVFEHIQRKLADKIGEEIHYYDTTWFNGAMLLYNGATYPQHQEVVVDGSWNLGYSLATGFLPNNYCTSNGVVKLLAEAGKLSGLKRMSIIVRTRRCEAGPRSVFGCLFKLMGIKEGEPLQAKGLRGEDCCLRMEEGTNRRGDTSHDEPILNWASIRLSRELRPWQMLLSFKLNFYDEDIEHEVELGTALGLNARYTEVTIDTFSISSPPPVFTSEATADGRFDRITKLIICYTNDGRAIWRSGRRSVFGWEGDNGHKRLPPFPAKEWADLITRLFAACGALQHLVVKFKLCYSVEFDKEHVPEAADIYWAAIDAMCQELRAISGGIVATATVEVEFYLDIPQPISKIREDHPIFQVGDLVQIRSYPDYVKFYSGMTIREGERVRISSGSGGEDGEGVECRGSMVVTWFVQLGNSEHNQGGSLPYWDRVEEACGEGSSSLLGELS